MFSAIENSSTSPRRCRSSGMWPRPDLKWPRALSPRDVLAGHGYPARGHLAQPGHGVDQLGLAVAVDAGDADDLSRPHVEREAAHLLDAAVVEHVQVLDLEQRRRSGWTGPCRRAAAPRGRPSAARGSARSLPPAGSVSILLPRRSTVIRSATSVTSFSLWLMKMIDLPCAVRPRMISKSSPASCGVSTAVGSSSTRMSAFRYSAFRISTRCCWPTVMSSMRAFGSTASPNRSEMSRTRSLASPRSRNAPPCVGSSREHDVLGHRHHRDQHEVLVHHPDAGVDRRPRRAELNRLAA